MIRVTAAIIRDKEKILIAQRKRGSSLELKWELPGGKIELNESPEECLKRELLEEFGIETEILGFFTSNTHRYKDITVKLLAFNVRYIKGDFALNSHEKVHWVNVKNLKDYDFAEADIPIIEKIVETENVI